jgi:DNA-binding CsgD family transcriptional regulator
MAVAAAQQRLRGELVWLMHRGLGVRDFSLAAARLLARVVPFDGVCVLTMDPATLLPTGEVVEHGLPPAATARMGEIELSGEDFNSFRALARGRHPAGILSDATGGELDRSVRHREVRGPHGFGDELRVTLVDDATTWGALTLLRGADHRHFIPTDAALAASVARYLAESLRQSLLLNVGASEPHHDEEPPGVLLLADDNTITMADAAAERWLADLQDSRAVDALPVAVTAVAGQARLIAHVPSTTQVIARARVRTATGRWLIVRGSQLGDRRDAPTAVTIEPVSAHALAPLIAAAHGLTDRERAVTQLVARGYPTAEIADRLHLSPWTVQDHLKVIFEKIGVGTRAELVARLFFFEGHAPRLNDYDRDESGQ